MRMTSLGSQVAAPTSACWPIATRRGPAAAAPASAWAVMGSHARVSNREGHVCLLGMGGAVSVSISLQPDCFYLRCREMKEFTQHFAYSEGHRRNLNPHLRIRLFPLPYSGSMEDCQLAHSIHSFIFFTQQVSSEHVVDVWHRPGGEDSAVIR